MSVLHQNNHLDVELYAKNISDMYLTEMANFMNLPTRFKTGILFVVENDEDLRYCIENDVLKYHETNDRSIYIPKISSLMVEKDLFYSDLFESGRDINEQIIRLYENIMVNMIL